MIVATIVFEGSTGATVERHGTRALPYDKTTLAVMALGVLAYTGGRRTLAQISDDGTWSSSAPKLAALLQTFFGADYTPMTYYSPDRREVEVARDAAWALGGEELGAITDVDDEEDDVVF